MNVISAKPRGIGTIFNGFIRRSDLNVSGFASLIGKSESSVRNWTNHGRSMTADELLDMAPRLPAEVVFDILCDIGAGRYSIEPAVSEVSNVATVGELSADVIRLVGSVAHFAGTVNEAEQDGFIDAAEAASIRRELRTIWASFKVIAAKLAKSAGRSLIGRTFTRERA